MTIHETRLGMIDAAPPGDGIEFAREDVVLREQLSRVPTDVRHDEEATLSFERLEQALMATPSLADLLPIILDGYRIAFSLDAVSLVLHDPVNEIVRLTAGTDARAPHRLVLVKDDALLAALFGNTRDPVFANFNAARDARLFGKSADGLGSVALLPILRQDRLRGSLNLGSRDPARLVNGVGTPFLRRLAGLFGICLDNALFRDRLTGVGLTDPLTGVNDRRYFEKRLAEEINHALRHPTPLSCLMFGFDRVRRISDTHRREAGDPPLKHMAETMQSQLRVSDSFARYGLEEFVALLPRTGHQQAHEVALRIRAGVSGRMFHLPGDPETRLNVSIGLASLDGLKAEGAEGMAREIVSRAHAALGRAKEAGWNRVVCADAN